MIEHKKFANGFEYIEVSNVVSSAKISLQGAHIFEYKCSGETLIWLSEASDFEYGKAIRGGVPLCWPRFGSIDKTLPQHGFARTEMFEFVSSTEIDEETTELIFRLKENSNTLKIWNYKFVLELKITLGQTLTMELTTTNVDTQSYMITQALHSYFPVSHISEAEVVGLDGKPYVDAVDGKTKLQRGAIVFNAEVNRVYQEVKDSLLLVDKNRTIRVKNSGSNSVVVWNPAKENCHNMSAFNDDSYETFVCIESSNAFDDTITLEPNASHTLKAVIDTF